MRRDCVALRRASAAIGASGSSLCARRLDRRLAREREQPRRRLEVVASRPPSRSRSFGLGDRHGLGGLVEDQLGGRRRWPAREVERLGCRVRGSRTGDTAARRFGGCRRARSGRRRRLCAAAAATRERRASRSRSIVGDGRGRRGIRQRGDLASTGRSARRPPSPVRRTRCGPRWAPAARRAACAILRRSSAREAPATSEVAESGVADGPAGAPRGRRLSLRGVERQSGGGLSVVSLGGQRSDVGRRITFAVRAAKVTIG